MNTVGMTDRRTDAEKDAEVKVRAVARSHHTPFGDRGVVVEVWIGTDLDSETGRDLVVTEFAPGAADPRDVIQERLAGILADAFVTYRKGPPR